MCCCPSRSRSTGMFEITGTCACVCVCQLQCNYLRIHLGTLRAERQEHDDSRVVESRRSFFFGGTSGRCGRSRPRHHTTPFMVTTRSIYSLEFTHPATSGTNTNYQNRTHSNCCVVSESRPGKSRRVMRDANRRWCMDRTIDENCSSPSQLNRQTGGRGYSC